jgi:hypothetical protein
MPGMKGFITIEYKYGRGEHPEARVIEMAVAQYLKPVTIENSPGRVETGAEKALRAFIAIGGETVFQRPPANENWRKGVLSYGPVGKTPLKTTPDNISEGNWDNFNLEFYKRSKFPFTENVFAKVGNEENYYYVDETISGIQLDSWRGAERFHVVTMAIGEELPLWELNEITGYYLFCKEREGFGVSINSIDRNLVYTIHQAYVQKFQETGSPKDAQKWLFDESPWANSGLLK